MATHVDIPVLEELTLDITKDAVVIDGVTKVFKKSRPLLRFRKKQDDEKNKKR